MEVKKNDKINFVCLKERCPEPCCGKFEGLTESLISLYQHKFSDIPIKDETVEFIKKKGEGDKIYLDEQIDLWYIKLQEDNSCPFHTKGLCEIEEVKPPICRAYPFYLDPSQEFA